MKRNLLLLILLVFIGSGSNAQLTRYLVKLKNKGNSPYSLSSPAAYLSPRALARRLRYTIPLDSADLPVTPSYINQISSVPNVTVHNVSKWLNALSIQTNDPAAISTISGFPFVQSVTGIASRNAGTEQPVNKIFEQEQYFTGSPLSRPGGISGDFFNYGTNSYREIHLHRGEFLHNIGLRGQGMQIAMLDNGFNNYTVLKAFDSVNLNGQVLGTWDFVARELNVSNDGSHGMNCFSTIAANIPGQFIGMAPKAGFWLYQTEDNASEYPIEELNWSCGAERADSSGADVISTSLGYTTFDNASLNHTYNDMNGNTTMGAIAADMAAKKGLIVFAAIGNDGGNSWHYLSTPSDGDSVVAVGAVDTLGNVAGFSSYGPSSDGQVKPDLASIGVNALIQTTGNTVGTGNGTSFATPNMAGLGTCLWQGFPEFNNMQVIRAMQRSGNIFSTPNSRSGYGVPNMKTAFGLLLIDYATSSSALNACTVTVNWSSKDVQSMKYEIERKAPGESIYTKVGELNPAPGDILTNHSYQFNNVLVNVTAGLVSYRIRQIIDTVTASFTAVYVDTTDVTVGTGCIATGTGNPPAPGKQVRVSPNPVSGNTVTLIIETTNAISSMPVLVYDTRGRLMMELYGFKGSGKKTINLPLGKLAKGKYYIKVLDGSHPIGTAELLKL